MPVSHACQMGVGRRISKVSKMCGSGGSDAVDT
jgi:hypothetical protein